MHRHMPIVSTFIFVLCTLGVQGRSMTLPIKDRFLLLVNAKTLTVSAENPKTFHTFRLPISKEKETDSTDGKIETIVACNDWDVFGKHLNVDHLDFDKFMDIKNPKSLASRLQEIKNYAAAAKAGDKPVLIELTEFTNGFKMVTYAKVFDAKADLPRYQKVWKRFAKVTDAVLFVPEYVPKNAAEFEEQLRLRCRIDRDRLLATRRTMKPAEMKSWLKRLDEWRKTPEKDHDAFVKLVSSMREAFVPGTILPPETFKVIPSDGTLSSLWNFRDLMERTTIKPDKRTWHTYEVEIITDSKGRLLTFDARYPELKETEVIHPAQIRIFLNKALRSDFHDMRDSPFKVGRQLPEAFPRMCRDFLVKMRDDGSSRYVFFLTSSSSGAAHVTLEVKGGKVTDFSALEKRLQRIKVK